jgi:hypothetical protein
LGEYTNKHNYPEWLCNVLKYNPYTTGPKRSDISTTQLIDSPQVLSLRKANRDNIVEDVSDRTWAVWGSAVHAICEYANMSNSDVLVEKRFHKDYGSHSVSGQVDIYDIKNNIIYDIKTVGAFALSYGIKPAWTNQLNVLADLMKNDGWKVSGLAIVAFSKDFNEKNVKPGSTYPESALKVIHDIPYWPVSETRKYIDKRLQRHFFDEHICDREERWQSESKVAVMKKKKVRAVKLFDTEDDANDFIITQKDQEDLYIEDRPGFNMRCSKYCNVKRFCPQHTKEYR